MREFKGEIKEVNGKKVLVIKVDSETIVKPDGSKSVIIHAPALHLKSEGKKLGGK